MLSSEFKEMLKMFLKDKVPNKIYYVCLEQLLRKFSEYLLCEAGSTGVNSSYLQSRNRGLSGVHALLLLERIAERVCSKDLSGSITVGTPRPCLRTPLDGTAHEC